MSIAFDILVSSLCSLVAHFFVVHDDRNLGS
jgi:hypothetical protein